jgi:hypothetical protein
MAIIVPNISWIISGQFNKIPAVTKIYKEEKEQQSALKDCYMGWRGNNSTEQTALDRKNCIDRHTDIHNNLWRDYHNMQMEQTGQAIELSKISPFGLFRFLSDKISGNNFHGYIYFFKQVKDYQLTFRNYVTEKDKADIESRHIFWNEWHDFYEGFMSRQPIVPDEVPQFTTQPQTFHELIADTVGDIAILCLWVLGLFGFSFVSFIKHDVR